MPLPKTTTDDFKVIFEDLNSNVPRGKRNRFDSGPKGLGDPDDLTLSRIERNAIVPSTKKEIIEEEYCYQEAADYEKCIKEHRFLSIFRCTDSKCNINTCIKNHLEVNNLDERAKNRYLEKRTFYRRTGLLKGEENPKKEKRWYEFIIRLRTPDEFEMIKDKGFWETIKFDYFRNKNTKSGEEDK